MANAQPRRMLKRRDFTFDLVAVTPLHIGAGCERHDLLTAVRGAAGEETRPAVSAIQRDAAGCPWLPGSALKGALRALDATPDAALFGKIKRAQDEKENDRAEDGEKKHPEDDKGVMGALLVRGAAMVAPGSTEGLPVPRDDAGRALAGDGVYVSARTAIDAGRGTAEANKLFHAEMVAPGARFAARLRLETPGDIDALEARLLGLLAAWSAPEGVAVGADAASGLGRLRLDGDVTRTCWAPDLRGALVAGAIETVATPAPAPVDAVLLRLICDGPFLTRDPAAPREGEKGNEIKALRLDDKPFVTGQALSGALRARLAWLLALDRHQGGGDSDAADRLFGIVGRRGVLTVMVEAARRDDAAALTSLRIDRFSGGPIDNALFTVHADLRVSLDLRLTLDRRAEEADRDTVERLVDDLKINGLTLGHGVNRGSGGSRWRIGDGGADHRADAEICSTAATTRKRRCS